jgi:DNA-binding GntR family transcriptional regulator
MPARRAAAASRGTATRAVSDTPVASMVDRAYDAVRSRILDNAWPPGHQVLEHALALDLGMSRTPVREAMIRLQKEGLIEVVPRHGMRVLPLSPTDMRDLCQILASLEAAAAGLAAARRPTGAELDALEQASRDMDAALRRDDLEAWAEADERFHRHLVELSGNRLLLAVVENVWDRAHRARMFTLRLRRKPTRSTREHRAVVQAIRKGDVDAARELHREHRERGGRELVALLERYRFRQI